jgi:hypothetical protein
MDIKCTTEKGGSVSLNAGHQVWASYAVAGVAERPPAELLYAGAALEDGRSVQFFLNRETGLICVDIIGTDGRSGTEVLRIRADAVMRKTA